MIYYKILPSYNDTLISGTQRAIANELYTEKEAFKLSIAKIQAIAKVITISSKNTYKSFGARFEKLTN